MSDSIKATPLAHLPCTALSGVGPSLAAKLGKLGLNTVQDILFHLPARYLDRTRIIPIAQLQLNTSVVIEGTVCSSQVQFGRRRSLLVMLEDETGRIGLRFFHFNNAQKDQLKPGTRLRCFGDPRMSARGLEFYHPEYEFCAVGDRYRALKQALTPVYPSTEGLNQNRLRKLSELALGTLEGYPPEELLPSDVNQRFGVKSVAQALRYVHYPPAEAPVEQLQNGTHPFQRRLVFEELLAHHLSLQISRAAVKRERAPALVAGNVLSAFMNSLPFNLTAAQTQAIEDIQNDLNIAHPMLRLVQGDVGSGKTLVAAVAAICAADSGYQAAIVAPTEILAEQHYANFKIWFETLGYQVQLLVGKLGAKQKREALENIKSHCAHVIVGTHALFEGTVEFAQLGLVIIDEQHRFGVKQRLTLRSNNTSHERPHQLLMTATPIPRTLAMTTYADLDLSIIDELPPGRTPINTVLVSHDRKAEVMERVRHACAEGRQAYWVCTLIENSETLSATAAEESYQQLCEKLPELQIGLVHGRLKSKEKERVMTAFKTGDIQLLVATTVIEVGVDVPNASLMTIENPERLGLAQLHQLRGRVGRGQTESHCVLLYGSPLSQLAKQRLQALRKTHDGFVIAEEDLRIRGPGELLGTRQTGELQFRLADLQRDSDLLPDIHKIAARMLALGDKSAHLLIRRWFQDQLKYLNS